MESLQVGTYVVGRSTFAPPYHGRPRSLACAGFVPTQETLIRLVYYGQVSWEDRAGKNPTQAWNKDGRATYPTTRYFILSPSRGNAALRMD